MGPDDVERPRRTSRVPLTVVSVLVAVQVLLQQPGKVVHETRLDVAFDPAGFMGQTWHLWQSANDMGRVQNQAVGYLFPMGPFFAGGHLLDVPTWLLQRLWISSLLVIALWGAARLADEWGIGEPWTRVLGATAYALGPLFLARTGVTSAFVIGGAFLPWVLLPLVRGCRTGHVRQAACGSGVAVLAMGGVNGAVTAAVLVMPLLYLITRERGPVRARLLRWWIGAVVLASAWWFGPLVFQSGYGADFLTITERARVITSVTAPFEVVRGTADWLAYYHARGPALPAGYFGVTSRWAILATGLVAAAGLGGLARRGLPERRFLATTFLVGVAIVGAGYGGVLGNPAASQVGQALDGFLGTFRTLYKFEPLIALPLALGLVHVVAVAVAAAGRLPARTRMPASVAVAVVATGIVLLAALPLLTPRLLHDQGFAEVPSWWTETADYLETTSGRALLVPGLSQSSSTWGYTEEEPLQWLTSQAWATRSIAPLGGEGTIAYLDTVEAAISRGGDPGLASFLRRAGFSTVVARNDADWQRYGAPDPTSVHEALVASGLQPVASFGPELSRPAGSTGPALHQIEIYGVPGSAQAVSYPQSTSLLVSGGTDSLLALADAGLGDRAAVLARDQGGDLPLPPNWVVTDGNPRRYLSFGLNRDNRSYLLGPDQDTAAGQPAGQGFFPDDRPESQTVATVTGVDGVTASSYGSSTAALPEVAPGQAVDGDPSTAWVAIPVGQASTDQWLQVDLEQPIDVDHVTVQLLEDGPWRPRVESLRVTTDRGSVVTDVAADESTQTLAVPPGPTSSIRVTFASIAEDPDASTGAGIRELTIPGVEVSRVVTVPSEFTSEYSSPSANLPTYLFNRFRSNPLDLSRRDEETTMARRFVTPKAGTWGLAATLAPVPSPGLLDLIDTTPGFTVSATSTAGNLPRFAPRNLVDGQSSTMWIAATSNGAVASDPTPPEASPAPAAYDPQPAVTMQWGAPRTIDTLSLTTVPGYSAPHEITISDGSETRTADVPSDGVVHFAPLTTDHATVTVTKLARVVQSSVLGRQTERPLALSEMTFSGLDDLLPAPPSDDETFPLACADGPTATIGSTRVEYAATFTYRDLVALSPVEATPCSDSFTLPAGESTLTTSVGSGSFTLDTFELVSPGLATGGTAGPEVQVTSWNDDVRRLQVGAGDASYLVVNDSYNRGWEATLDGQRLEPVRIDGWRQGFVLPASQGGGVTVRFTPTTPYRASLVIGGLLALLLIVLAIVFTVTDRRRARAPQPATTVGTWGSVASISAPLVISVLVAGIGGLVILPLWLVARRWHRWLAWLAGGAFALGATWAAWSDQTLPTNSHKALGSAPSLLALVALLALAATLLPRPDPAPPADQGGAGEGGDEDAS